MNFILLDVSIIWPPIIQVVGAMIAVGASIWIYRRFDVEKQFKQKQFETVISLVQDLEGQTLNFEHKQKDGHDSTWPVKIAHVKKLLTEDRFKELIKVRPLYINVVMLQEIKFLSYMDNLLIPKSIAVELRKFDWVTKTDPDLKELNDYMYVSHPVDWGGYNPAQFNPPLVKVMKFEHPIYDSVASYLKQILALRTAIGKWLEQFGIKDLNVQALK